MANDYKYAPLPEEPRYKKKSRKSHVRSDHKHDYEMVCIDAHTEIYRHGERVPYLYHAKRCKICGRLGDMTMMPDLHEPPKEMALYVVDDIWELLDMKILPEEMRVR